MPRFIIGDELGHIKALEYASEPIHDGKNYKLTTLSKRPNEDQKVAIQRIVVDDIHGSRTVIAGYSNGAVSVSAFQEEGLQLAKEWKDTRLKLKNSYIGLASHENKVFSCTSNGALNLTTIPDLTQESTLTHTRSLIPTRLYDWKLSSDSTTFAYGGDEVELSVWNTEAAFQPLTEDPSQSKKRKRNDLFPGEVWRAKNVANDSLGLRQPVRITSLDYFMGSSGHQIVTGTQLGDVRRYDTRAARRPVADWRGIGKVGGIQVVKTGLSEHELFVSDHGTNLFSLDLRNGRVIYGYKGIAGSVTSVAPSPDYLMSTANDRYARAHSTFPPPEKEAQNLDKKGDVLEKIYVASVPTVVVWDNGTTYKTKETNPIGEQDDDVWNELEAIQDSDTEIQKKNKRRHISEDK